MTAPRRYVLSGDDRWDGKGRPSWIETDQDEHLYETVLDKLAQLGTVGRSAGWSFNDPDNDNVPIHGELNARFKEGSITVRGKRPMDAVRLAADMLGVKLSTLSKENRS